LGINITIKKFFKKKIHYNKEKVALTGLGLRHFEAKWQGI